MRNDDLKLTISTGLSRKEKNGWRPVETTWGRLVKKLSEPKRLKISEAEYWAMTKDDRSANKDVGGFVGGTIANGQRKDINVLSRCIVSLDIDEGDANTWGNYEMMCDWECLMHTTCSHTPEKPRYRLFLPLKRQVTPDEYEPLARKIAEQLDIDLFDDTTYQPVRLMYWPACPLDGEFKVWRHEGPLADPDEILGWYTDWRSRKEWPCSSRTTIDLHERLGKQESPTLKMNIVGAFSRVYDIPGAIDAFLPDVYAPNETDERRYTYIPGSTADGLCLWGDHGDEDSPPWVFAYSFHSTDPAYMKLLNAFDLVRIHKFPSSNPGDKDADKASYEAMRSFALLDERVREKMDEITQMTSSREPPEQDDELHRLGRDYSEQGNALRLKDLYLTRMRYNGGLGWCIWDGSVWLTNRAEYAMLNVMRLADIWHDEAERAMQLAPKPEKGLRKEDWPQEYKDACNLYAWAKQCRNRTNQQHTLTSAQAVMLLPEASAFDADPWLLNTPDGIVDLRTGEMKPHQAEYLCTKLTGCPPDWDAPHPMWDGFLDKITNGDKELERYLQGVAGMALVGKVYEEGVVICYGPGGNGKSTLFEIWKTVMGDYAMTVRNEVVMGNPNGNEVAGQAQLRGARLVITGELEAGQAMSNSMLKRITSRDDIQANIKYMEPITFTPTHTLVLHTNHLPKLKSVDEGTRRRIAIVPLLAVIKKEEKVMDFAGELLKTEAGAVLAWMIDGAKMFYENGTHIEKPKAVVRMSEEFMQEADVFGTFLSEKCDVGGELTEGTARLFEAYRGWMNECDLKPFGKLTFKKILRERGITTKHESTGDVFVGVRLKGEFDDAQSL